jgi:hypothetical protein
MRDLDIISNGDKNVRAFLKYLADLIYWGGGSS